jgi:hypothetical protein
MAKTNNSPRERILSGFTIMPSVEQRSYDRRKASVNGSVSQDKTQEVRNSKSRQTGNVNVNELLISSLAQTDVLAKLLIEKGLITRGEFMQKISEERAVYRKLLNPTPQ